MWGIPSRLPRYEPGRTRHVKPVLLENFVRPNLIVQMSMTAAGLMGRKKPFVDQRLPFRAHLPLRLGAVK